MALSRGVGGYLQQPDGMGAWACLEPSFELGCDARPPEAIPEGSSWESWDKSLRRICELGWC